MKKIMIFMEGTTFYTRPIIFLFSKKGYLPIGNAVNIINSLYNEGNEIYLVSYVKKKRYCFIKKIITYYKINYTEILCRKKRRAMLT